MPTLKPRKRPKQQRSRETYDAIVAATTRVLKREGYEKASTNRIAEVAGVSVGSLYQYFPNKQALVIAVVERHSDQLIAMLERTIADLGAAPIPDAVRTFVRAMLAAHALDPQLHRVLVQQVMHIGLEHTRKFDRRAQQLVRAYLERDGHRVVEAADGPAAVEAQSRRSRLPTTISPFVPRSINAAGASD